MESFVWLWREKITQNVNEIKKSENMKFTWAHHPRGRHHGKAAWAGCCAPSARPVQMALAHSKELSMNIGQRPERFFLVSSRLFLLLCHDSELLHISLLLALWICFPKTWKFSLEKDVPNAFSSSSRFWCPAHVMEPLLLHRKPLPGFQMPALARLGLGASSGSVARGRLTHPASWGSSHPHADGTWSMNTPVPSTSRLGASEICALLWLPEFTL